MIERPVAAPQLSTQRVPQMDRMIPACGNKATGQRIRNGHPRIPTEVVDQFTGSDFGRWCLRQNTQIT